MTINDSVIAYIAANNLEAHAVCNLLLQAGIEATVIEDNSQAGMWIGGLASQLHKPQVLIERVDIDRTKPVLDAYEQRAARRQFTGTSDGTIEVQCEECGKTSLFPEGQRGSVQSCPHCEAFVDVGEDSDPEDWGQVSGEEQRDT